VPSQPVGASDILPKMNGVRWLLDRVFAAVLGAFAAGILAAVILTAQETLTCRRECAPFWGQLLFNLIYGPVFSIILGAGPGLVALTLTPAKSRPWRSLPTLVLGAVAGFAIWMCVPPPFNADRVSSVALLGYMVILPSSTLLLTAWNIERLSAIFDANKGRA
jgi:hypothetical protein